MEVSLLNSALFESCVESVLRSTRSADRPSPLMLPGFGVDSGSPAPLAANRTLSMSRGQHQVRTPSGPTR